MTDKDKEEKQILILTYMQRNPRVTFEDVADIFHTTYEQVLQIAVDNKLWG